MTAQRRFVPWLLVFATGCAGRPLGVQGAVGPVFSYVIGRGRAFGWEASGGGVIARDQWNDRSPGPGDYNLLPRGSVGMSWRPSAAGASQKERLLFVAWEPWYKLGWTLGYAHSSVSGSLPDLGAWAGAFLPFGADRYACIHGCGSFSLAIGYRWSGASELYVTPKLGGFTGADFSAHD